MKIDREKEENKEQKKNVFISLFWMMFKGIFFWYSSFGNELFHTFECKL